MAIPRDGSPGPDTLTGTVEDEIFTLLEGDDTILLEGETGLDSYFGGDGTDTIRLTYHTTISVLELGAANSIEILDAGNFNLSGTALDDVWDLSGLTEIRGGFGGLLGAGNDLFHGSDLVGRGVQGEGGNDTLHGGGSNDALYGGSGDDLIYGGAGNDRIYSDTGFARQGAGRDTLYGGDGDDNLYVDAGTNTSDVYGGDGFDIIFVSDPVSNLIITAEQSIEALGFSSYYSYQHILRGTDQADVWDLSLITRLNGASGKVWQMGVGDDLYMAGAYAIGRPVTLTVRGDEGNDTLIGSALADTLNGGDDDDELHGGQGHDDLTAGLGNDTLYGGAGNDTLRAGVGTNLLIGGTGDDWYMVTTAGAPVTIVESASANGGIDTVFSSVTISLATTAYVENLTLTGGKGISGTGNRANNVIKGNTVANTLYGLEGADTMMGDQGSDQLYGGAGDDVLYGGGSSQHYIGQTYADTLDGGTGADTMEGGGGADTYIVDNTGDVVRETRPPYATNERDLVQASISYVMGNTSNTHIEDLTLTGSDNLGGTGNSHHNRIIGNSGNNVLRGASGDDTMSGGAGLDTLEGGVGSDNLMGQDGADVLMGDEGSDRLFGGAGNDVLYGETAGNPRLDQTYGDTLDGGTGADTMEGGGGSDTYIVDNTGDVVREVRQPFVFTDRDLVLSAVSFTMGTQHIEDLVLTGNGHIFGTGNVLANRITGNGGNNLLRGGAGNDTLNGGEGVDTLDGGGGNDTLAGGDGVDFFVFRAGGGADQIDGFEVGPDRVQVVGFTAADISLVAQGANTLATLIPTGDTLLFVNIPVAALQDMADFDFI